MTEEKIVSATDAKQLNDKERGTVNLGRHQAQCTICLSSCRQEIEELFVDWVSPDLIIKQFTNISRDSVYRHAHAWGLFDQRKKNIGRALEKIIERVDFMSTTGSQVISAIQTYVKLNRLGQGTEQAQGPNPKELFELMSKEEREAFARDGSLPDWFSRAKDGTPVESQEGEQESQAPEPQKLQ
jgi:hypothetical protein